MPNGPELSLELLDKTSRSLPVSEPSDAKFVTDPERKLISPVSVEILVHTSPALNEGNVEEAA